MFASRIIMAILPNIHLLGALIVSITVVFRIKALYPLYTYIFLEGIFSGFDLWWIPYLYVWTVLWGITMLLPRNIPKKIKPIIYMIVSSFHGFIFGILYAPGQALLFGLDFEGMIGWIIYGLPADITHGISNFFCGLLICPIIMILKNSNKYIGKN